MSFRNAARLALVAAALVATHREARACGGCFHPASATQTASSVVTGHRMAVAVSPTRTVLWDQVQYAGDPAEFAWVLPVFAGAYLELADDAFFESLEAVTATRVVSPPTSCGGQGTQTAQGGFGCGSSATDSATPNADAPGSTPDSGVTVVHEGAVGPYETVTLRSSSGESIADWLVAHGYAIPADVRPVVDAYVSEGADFLALRLRPDAGVRQMSPVRVVMPGASSALPLRMVAAGTGAEVDLVLYVLAEGRWRAKGFGDAFVDDDALSWDFAAQRSNYAALRTAAFAAHGGQAFLTSFARAGALTAKVPRPDGTAATYQLASPYGYGALGSYDDLAHLYFAQAAADVGTADVCQARAEAFASPSFVAEACVAGQPCDAIAPDAMRADVLTCGGFSDLATAVVGMHPSDVWVTRLEARLPRAALASDLTLVPAAQTGVSNWHRAPLSTGTPCAGSSSATSSSGSTSSTHAQACATRGGRGSPLVPSVLAIVGLGWALRVRARRRAAIGPTPTSSPWRRASGG